MHKTIHALTVFAFALGLLSRLGSAAEPATAGDAKGREAAAQLTDADRDFVGRAVAQVEFLANLGRAAAERAQIPEVRTLAQNAVKDYESFLESLSAWADERGVLLGAHPTQQSNKSGAEISGAGSTDNIGQSRATNAAATPTEQMPREAAERDTTGNRAGTTLAPNTENRARSNEAGVHLNVQHRQEIRLRKLLDSDRDEFDRAFLDQVAHEQDELIELFKDHAGHGKDPGLEKIVGAESPRLQARQENVQRVLKAIER